MRSLEGKVAVVAGATRGTGRGIARALGEVGMTVYCTGRSVRGAPSPYGRPETIEETADMVTAAGGKGIAVRVDHTVEDEVKALFARVESEQGRLDVLVNCIAGEDPALGSWGAFMDLDLSLAPDVMQRLVISHLITARHGAALMMKGKRGLIVEVTGGDTIIGGSGGNLLVELAKSGQKALAFLLSEELRAKQIAAVAVTPGFLRSEAMLEHFGVTEETWRDGGRKDPHFLHSETPLFIGRGIAALAADPKVMQRSGDTMSSWELARAYGVTDADGSRPDWGRHAREVVVHELPWYRQGMERYAAFLERALARARDQLGDPSVAAPSLKSPIASDAPAADAQMR